MGYYDGYRAWGGDAVPGEIHVVDGPDIKALAARQQRVGHNKVNPKLKHGDLLLVARHSGDCFYDYIPLRRSPADSQTVTPALSRKFGAYQGVARPTGITLDSKRYHLAMAGLPVKVRLPRVGLPGVGYVRPKTLNYGGWRD